MWPAQIGSNELTAYARALLAKCDSLGEPMISAAYALPFVDAEVRFTGHAYANFCRDGLVQRGALAPPAAKVRLTVAESGRGGLPEPAAWSEDLLLPLEMERRLAPADLRGSFFHDGRIWQFYDMARRHGVSLSPGPAAYPPWEHAAPLRTLLAWTYAAIGLRLVHAGTLGIDGRGVLIAGRGGAGKSSTTLAGILSGMDSVGDDYVVLDLREEPVAYPLYRLMKVDRDGFGRLGLATRLDDPGPLNWQGKYEFDFEKLGRGRRTPALRIEAILVPTIIAGQHSTIRPVGKREAMLALAPSSLFQLHGDRQGSARALAELVRRLPCYAIDLGSDPAGIADAIVSLMRAQQS